MSEIIILGDPKNILNKDCPDFQPLEDGTKAKEKKYCGLSDLCRQIGIAADGTAISMEAHYLPIVPADGSQVMEWKYFCTGIHDIRSRAERLEDDKVS